MRTSIVGNSCADRPMKITGFTGASQMPWYGILSSIGARLSEKLSLDARSYLCR